jgi:dimethylargininase
MTSSMDPIDAERVAPLCRAGSAKILRMDPRARSMKIAITREVSPAIDRCELTHLARTPIDVGLAREQHHRYEESLSDLGYVILRLPAERDLPDSVFVEDIAVVLDEMAILTRPGAPSRRAEIESVAAALAPHRPLARIEPPATLDGGDVMRIGKSVYIGLSSRTGEPGVEQMRQLIEPFGYSVHQVPVTGCLHLKSAVSQLGPETVLINAAWLAPGSFDGMDRVEVDPFEPFAANALLAGEAVVYPSAFPATRHRLEAHGLRVVSLDMSELEKAEGGVTCCSLLLTTSAPGSARC